MDPVRKQRIHASGQCVSFPAAEQSLDTPAKASSEPVPGTFERLDQRRR